MLIPSFQRNLKSLFKSSRLRRTSHRRSRLSTTQHTALYRIERLEDRTMLSAHPGWAFSLGTADGIDSGWEVNVEPISGDVFMVGRFAGIVDFDPGPGTDELTSEGVVGFIARYTAQQELVWATKVGGTAGSADFSHIGVRQVEFDALGNIYINGSFEATSAEFGSFTLIGNASADAYVAKLDASGDFLWVRGLAGPGTDFAISLDVQPDGTVHVGGTFEQTVDFDPGPGEFYLTSALNLNGLNNGPDAFLWQLDTKGDFQNAVRFGAGLGDGVVRLGVDADGNVSAIGYFSGDEHEDGIETVDFGTTADGVNLTLTNDSGTAYDVFVSRWDSNLKPIWVRQVATTGSGNEGAPRVSGTIDGSGNVYVSASFSQDADFGAGAPTLTGGGVYVAKYDVNGNFQWVHHLQSDMGLANREVQVDATGNVYLEGHFSGTVDFDPANPGTHTLTKVADDGLGTLAFLTNDGFLLRLRVSPKSGLAISCYNR